MLNDGTFEDVDKNTIVVNGNGDTILHPDNLINIEQAPKIYKKTFNLTTTTQHYLHQTVGCRQ